MAIRAIQNHVLVTGMSFEERVTNGGIVLMSDDQKSTGIRPRWGKVVAVGHQQKHIKVGQYVMVAHGRWTRGIEMEGMTVRRVDTDDILVVSDVHHIDESMAGSEVVIDQQEKSTDDLYEQF